MHVGSKFDLERKTETALEHDIHTQAICLTDALFGNIKKITYKISNETVRNSEEFFNINFIQLRYFV